MESMRWGLLGGGDGVDSAVGMAVGKGVEEVGLQQFSDEDRHMIACQSMECMEVAV